MGSDGRAAPGRRSRRIRPAGARDRRSCSVRTDSAETPRRFRLGGRASVAPALRWPARSRRTRRSVRSARLSSYLRSAALPLPRARARHGARSLFMCRRSASMTGICCPVTAYSGDQFRRATSSTSAPLRSCRPSRRTAIIPSKLGGLDKRSSTPDAGISTRSRWRIPPDACLRADFLRRADQAHADLSDSTVSRFPCDPCDDTGAVSVQPSDRRSRRRDERAATRWSSSLPWNARRSRTDVVRERRAMHRQGCSRAAGTRGRVIAGGALPSRFTWRNPFKILEFGALTRGMDIRPTDSILDIGCGSGPQDLVDDPEPVTPRRTSRWSASMMRARQISTRSCS